VPRSLLGAPKVLEADLGLGDSGLAYGRRRGSSNGKTSFQAVENSTPLLALPPPTPLTKLPKLSELMEVGRASYRAAQAAKLAAPQIGCTLHGPILRTPGSGRVRGQYQGRVSGAFAGMPGRHWSGSGKAERRKKL